MKHYLLKALTWIAAASLLFSLSSCEKVGQQDETVSVYLTYTITTDNGEAMPGTKATNADVFNEFYQKIKSGELVAPNYNFVFTEKTTGAVYFVDGTWAGKDMVTLRTGTYSVVGTSTAVGENIQEKITMTRLPLSGAYFSFQGLATMKRSQFNTQRYTLLKRDLDTLFSESLMYSFTCCEVK